MFKLPELPYKENVLSPHMSEQTLSIHHGKHHKAYVDKLNELLADDPLSDHALEDVIAQSHGHDKRRSIFNNAAQIWNHDFFWKSMAPDGGGSPSGEIAHAIDRDLGGRKAFADAFTEAAVGHFGSGWVWLVHEDNRLKIVTTHDADLPMVHGQTAILTCDLWEHAYYLDYQNRRPAFVQAFLDHLVNWDFANANLALATGKAAEFAEVV